MLIASPEHDVKSAPVAIRPIAILVTGRIKLFRTLKEGVMKDNKKLLKNKEEKVWNFTDENAQAVKIYERNIAESCDFVSWMLGEPNLFGIDKDWDKIYKRMDQWKEKHPKK